MPHQIDVDDDVYQALQRQALPFVDTPNSVLRRLLSLDEPGAIEQGGSPPTTFDFDVGRDETPVADGDTARVSKVRRSSTRSSNGAAGRTKSRPQKGTRVKPGSILPEEEYELPLLTALVEAGGAAPSKEVIDRVGQQLEGRLTEQDKGEVASGTVRWRNRIQFVRIKLIDRGLMTKESPRGIWQITDAGRKMVESTQGGTDAE